MENQNVTPETPVEAQAPVTTETPVAPENVAPQVAPEAVAPQATPENVAPQATPENVAPQQGVAPQPAMQQPMYTQQPMYANPAVPPAAPKKKGNGLVIGLVVAIVVLVLALGGIVAFAAYNIFANSPEARLAKGISKWSATEKSKVATVSETLGWEEINNSMMHGATFKDLSLNMTFPALDIPTIGLDVVDTCDYPNQKDFSDWTVSISNIELINLQIAADADKLYLSIPTLLENTYAIGYEEFATNFNKSVWAEMLGTSIDEELELNPWVREDAQSGATSLEFSEEFLAELEAKIKEMSENIIIEETGTAIEVTRNGKTVKCDGIYVVVPEEDLNDIFDLIQDELRDGKYGQDMIAQLTQSGVIDVQTTWNQIVAILDARYTDDFQMIFYLDNKNNIVHMATPEVATMDNGISVGFAFDFVGDSNPTDVVEGLIKVFTEEGVNAALDFKLENKVSGSVATTEFELTATVEELGYDTSEAELEFTYEWDSDKKEFEMEANMTSEGETVLEFGMEGAFEDVVKNEGFTLELGSLGLSVDGESLMKISGEMEIKQLDEEVKIPSESIDFLGMTQVDITSMLLEIMQNADKMSSALESFSY